jgi:hypothetical protein
MRIEQAHAQGRAPQVRKRQNSKKNIHRNSSPRDSQSTQFAINPILKRRDSRSTRLVIKKSAMPARSAAGFYSTISASQPADSPAPPAHSRTRIQIAASSAISRPVIDLPQSTRLR